MSNDSYLREHTAQARPDKAGRGPELPLVPQIVPQRQAPEPGGFDDPRMALIIKGGRRLFPSKKRNRFPITKEILEKITEEELLSITDLNVDTFFKVAWAGFM